MSRWNVAIPRLVLIVILLSVASLGVNPAVRWAVSQALQTVTGAPVEVGSANTSLRTGVARLGELRLGDADAGQETIHANSAVLTIDPWALARGRLVIRDGEVRGLRIESAAEPLRRTAAEARLSNEASVWGESWQRAVGHQSPADQSLQTVRLAKQLRQQRQTEYQQIIDLAAHWQARFDELDGLIRIVGDNPLRMTPEYRARLEHLASLGDEIIQLDNRLAALRRQVQQDRMQLEAAREADLAGLEQSAELPSVDGEQLSNYLLEKQWSRRIGAWVAWVREARKLVQLQPARKPYSWGNPRGVDVLLNASRRPDLVVENLYLQGTGRLDSSEFRFHGTLQNLTDEPALANQPAVLTLAAEGPGAVQLDAVLDRSGPRPVDRIRMVCPALATPTQTLGKPQEFAVEVQPAQLEMAMLLEVEGHDIRGRVEFDQRQTALTPSWPGSNRPGPANETIQLALQEVNRYKGSVEISGSLKYPIWELTSDLGRQVATRMRHVMQDELSQRSYQMAYQAKQLADQAIQDVVDTLQQEERRAVQQVASKTTELEQFRTRIAQRTELMDRLIRDVGPLENLLR